MTALSRALAVLLLLTIATARTQAFQAPQIEARWVGQDGRDLVGGEPGPSKNDYQDIHFLVRGLPTNRKVVETVVKAHGGGEWRSSATNRFSVLLVRKGSTGVADVFVEPYQREVGREFEIHIKFDDGTEAATNFPGGKADPNLRAAGAGVEVKWLGQDGQDRTGTGIGVGPDGVEDVHLTLGRLTGQSDIKAVEVAGPAGLIWHAGLNPGGHPAAELVRQKEDRSRADFYFSPKVELAGKPLKVTVTYADDRTDTASLVGGKFQPTRVVHRSPVPTLATSAGTARWLGQDGVETSPGDVHVRLEGLAPGRTIVAAALSDSAVGTWVFKANDSVKFEAGSSTERLNVRKTSSTTGDLVFPPVRDESGTTMTLRLLDGSGREEVIRFPGGPADVGRRGPALALGTVRARPGDDLNDLASRSGTVTLSPGVYPMTRPLILNRPTRIVGEPGAILRFTQPSDQPPWTAAIKIHAGGSTLEGFAVRFDGPTRWDREVSFGPAVIATTDNRDNVPTDPKFGITLARLDLEGPVGSTDWEQSIHLIRVISASSGRIEGNRLRGGSVVFAGGPWTISENTYRGTWPRTFAFEAFSGRFTHDLMLSGNKARPDGPSGKTWRFLVLAHRGAFDRIQGNTVEGGIGPRQDDPRPHPNTPEVILTEAYRLHFEGKPTSISADGRVLVIPKPQGGDAGTGDSVAILSGPQAGQWRSIAQPIGPRMYLLDEPISTETDALSIASGFVRETFEDNTVDCRGSQVASTLVLAGNQFGARVIRNRLIGGAESIRLFATPTEEPVHWGWSHAPFLGGVIEGNTLEDSIGNEIAVEHSPAIKTNKGRVYMSILFKDNTLRWTNPAGKPHRLRIGSQSSLDPKELQITEEGTKLEGAPPQAAWVHAATINGRVVQEAALPRRK